MKYEGSISAVGESEWTEPTTVYADNLDDAIARVATHFLLTEEFSTVEYVDVCVRSFHWGEDSREFPKEWNYARVFASRSVKISDIQHYDPEQE